MASILKSSSILQMRRNLLRRSLSSRTAVRKLKWREPCSVWSRSYSSASPSAQADQGFGAFSPSSLRQAEPTPIPAVKVNITKTNGSSSKSQTDANTSNQPSATTSQKSGGSAVAGADAKVKIDACGPDPDSDEDDEADLEQMFILGPAGMEWGGPTRGGRRPEPTRYGDWERKGRASDF
jgi:hypothetical protein